MPQIANNKIVVAGHVCIDVFPTFGERQAEVDTLFVPGKLIDVGAALLSTGGKVSNTGLALHRLGLPTRLVGKVGDDVFGRATLDILRVVHPQGAEEMIVARGEASSYSIVISPPGRDRTFLHFRGCNDSFRASDVNATHLDGARIFHFGYPPAMRQFYLHDGAEIAKLFRRVRQAGLVTSLDMTRPDPDSEAGRIDWPALLRNSMPFVDIFLPSLDEILFMLDPGALEALEATDTAIDAALLRRTAELLLAWGAAVVVLKLGDQGLYLRTTDDPQKLAGLDRLAPGYARLWRNRELLTPCFQAQVVGTTGAGDCTIAGFLAALAMGMAPAAAMTAAVAVGAFNVEHADATSGIPRWETVQKRIQNGWQRCGVKIGMDGWRWDADSQIWRGPQDEPIAS